MRERGRGNNDDGNRSNHSRYSNKDSDSNHGNYCNCGGNSNNGSNSNFVDHYDGWRGYAG